MTKIKLNNPTPETINLTETWESLVPAFLALIENGNPKGRAWAIEEITRMAKAADIAVADKAKRDEWKAYAAEQKAQGFEVVPFDEWAGEGKTARQKADERLAEIDPDENDLY